MKIGSVTVYLSLVFVVILSLLITLINGARSQGIRLKTELAMDLTLQSVFAEYNRELLDQYDLFFIDTSYGDGQGSMENLEGHLEIYMEENFTEDSDIMGVFSRDLFQLETEQMEILDYSLASDEAGEIIRRQAISYMKDVYGVAYLEELNEHLTCVEDNSMLTRNIESEQSSNQQAIDSIEIPPKKVGEEKWEEVKLDNPADAVNAERSKGVLMLVTDADSNISETAVNLNNYISHREKNSGSGLGEREGSKMAEELIFNEYILRKCGNYCSPLEKGVLTYQAEYVLAGEDNDLENLKAMVNRLLLLREVSNAAYLFQDQAKVAEAEALALSLTAVMMVPELAELVKISILFAWSFAESVWDVTQLLKGGRIPLLKTSESWHYSLEGMLDYKSDLKSEQKKTGNSWKDGLCYEDYLRIFLATMDRDKKMGRVMDIIEMDIQKTAENGGFRLDFCVDYICAQAFVKSRYGQSVNITRSFRYM